MIRVEKSFTKTRSKLVVCCLEIYRVQILTLTQSKLNFSYSEPTCCATEAFVKHFDTSIWRLNKKL